MEFNSSTTLSAREREIRRVGTIGTIVLALVLVVLQLAPGAMEQYWERLGSIPFKLIVMTLLYGVFGLWCMAHLDVIGDRVFAGRIGRVSALRLGFASRAFGYCGCWSKSLRQRAWRQMSLEHKPARLKAIVRISNAAYVFGMVCSFLLVNLIFPDFLAGFLPFERDYVRFIFVVLIVGTLLLAWQRNTGLWVERVQAAMLVGLCQICAAFTIYIVNLEFLAASFGEILAVMVLASGIGWAMRVPFTFGVLELLMVLLAQPGQEGAVLAGITLFHICFQGPAFVTSMLISFAPGLTVPTLLGVSESFKEPRMHVRDGLARR